MKKFLNKERTIWIAAIVTLAVFLFLSKCKNNTAETTNEVNAYLTANTNTETVKGIDVSTVHQALLETQTQMKILIASNDTLRKLVKEFKVVNSITKVKTETFFKDSIRYAPIPCDFKPIHRTHKTNDYELSLTVKRDITSIDSLKIPNTIQFIEGSRKIGLFKTEQQVMAVNSNPLIKTVEIQSLTVKTKKKWWERPGPWFTLGAAVATGIIISVK